MADSRFGGAASLLLVDWVCFYRYIYNYDLVLMAMIVEIVGWAGRAWSSQCPYNSTAFLMQISTLIIGMHSGHCLVNPS